MMILLKQKIWFWIFISHILPSDSKKIKQLWPLDSQTCEAEVLIEKFQYQSGCMKDFETQPNGIPYRSMVFNESHVDVRVDFPTTGIEHYSVEGFFYFSKSKGVLFHYKADTQNKEVILWYENGNIRLYRRATSSLSRTYTPSVSISLNKWYYISFGVGIHGYVYVHMNGTELLQGAIGKRTDVEIPGNLRIGGEFSETKPKFNGLVTCVGFIWKSRTSLVSELLPQCQAASWMPLRQVNNLYFSSTSDLELFPSLIASQKKSSMIQCAYTCLQNPQCFYIYCNETNAGCNPCYMYDRVEQRTKIPFKLYEVKR